MSLLDDFAKFEEEAKELKKKTEELKKEIKKKPIIIEKAKTIIQPRKKREDKYQKQIDSITKQIENLTKQLTLSKNQIDNPLMDKIDDFKDYFNFSKMRKEIIEEHDLKPLDIFTITNKGRKPLFWDLKKIREDFPEYCEDKEEYFFVQLLNRMERDGKKHIEFTLEYTKKRMMDFIQDNKNKMEVI